MERVICVYLPHWEVELTRRQIRSSPRKSGKRLPAQSRRRFPPLIITAEIDQHRYVMRCCPAAAAAGVVPGMNLAEAMALCPQADIHPRQPDMYQQAIEKLARWAGRFSPRVMIDPTPHHRDEVFSAASHGLFIDISGTGHLHVGSQPPADRIRRALTELGFSPHLAEAPTIGAAWALAHYGSHAPASSDHEPISGALGHLPVAALRLSPEICRNLAAVGITEIQHLMDIPRPAVTDRFGPEVLRRLDQAIGRVYEDIEPFRDRPTFSATRQFEAPIIQLEMILAALEELIHELSSQLSLQWMGARELEVIFLRPYYPPNIKKISLMRPVCEPRHWWAVIRPYVERMHLGDGVQAISLTAVRTSRIGPRQTPMIHTDSARNDTDQLRELLDRLINKWGGRCLLRAAPAASHIPECAARREPIKASAFDHAGMPAWEWPPLDRPSILLDQPEIAQCVALQPESPPYRIEWRGANYPVISRIGPERIVTQRTLSHCQTRDYFKLQLPDGRWLWVYHRLEDDRWFVHGIWG